MSSIDEQLRVLDEQRKQLLQQKKQEKKIEYQQVVEQSVQDIFNVDKYLMSVLTMDERLGTLAKEAGISAEERRNYEKFLKQVQDIFYSRYKPVFLALGAVTAIDALVGSK